MSVSGSLLTGNADSIGVQFTEMQKGWLQNVIIEGFAKTATSGSGSIGLYLRGSTTAALGDPGAPHVWRCRFANVVVATSVRPFVGENYDENDFYNCNFGLPPGVTASADSLFALDSIQGHNNRFFGLLLSGEPNDLTKRAAYVGVNFRQPTKGDNLGNVIYGLVAEGFNKPIWFGGNLAISNGVRDYDSSINAVDFTDSAPQVGTRCFVDAPLHNINYRNSKAEYTDALTFAAGDTTPDVSGGNTFACANTAATSITTFDGGSSGQWLAVRLDSNTTLVQGTLKLPGGVNYKATGFDMTYWSNLGGSWYCTSIVSAQGAPVGQKVSSDRGNVSVTLTLADARIQYFNTALTINRTVTAPSAGSFNGDTFRVVRGASATGIGTLTAFGKALTVSQWIEATWNGSAWIETAFGSL